MVDRNVLKDIGITSVGGQLEIIQTLKQPTKSQGKQYTLLISNCNWTEWSTIAIAIQGVIGE